MTVTPLPINWITFTHLLSKHCSLHADSVAKYITKRKSVNDLLLGFCAVWQMFLYVKEECTASMFRVTSSGLDGQKHEITFD